MLVGVYSLCVKVSVSVCEVLRKSAPKRKCEMPVIWKTRRNAGAMKLCKWTKRNLSSLLCPSDTKAMLPLHRKKFDMLSIGIGCIVTNLDVSKM